VKVMGNPIVFSVLVVFTASMLSCLIGIWMVRRLRRSFTEDALIMQTTPPLDQFPVHTYNAVIQQLKQQKHELISERQRERRQAKASENISAAVLSNLSSGVLFLGSNGLIRKANSAAKSILGFASPSGMRVEDVFRNAALNTSAAHKLTSVVEESLREQTASRRVEVQYSTPAGECRMLEVTMTPVYAPSGEVLGAACLINDKTEMAVMQRQQELGVEMSAEMALSLRNSLTTISGYARQLAMSHDPVVTQRLAADILSEAAELDHTIGGYLSGAKTGAKTAAKAAGV
jgi:PAS domain S-box-containing protein